MKQKPSYDELVQRIKELECESVEYRRNREQNVEHQLFLESVLLHLPEAIVTLDNEHRVIGWNPGATNLFGYTAEEVIGAPLDDLVARGDHYDEAVAKTRQVLNGQGLAAFETVRYRKDGSPLNVIATGFPIIRDGTTKGVVAVYFDLSERLQAKESIISTNTSLQTILNSIPSDIYVADMDTYEVLFMNSHMQKSFGRDCTGKICWQAFRAETGPCSHCTNPSLLDDTGEPAGVITWENYNPVNRKWYLNYDRAVPWVDGRYVRIQIAADISARKQAEKALEFEAQSQKVLGEIANEFINIRPSTIDKAINRALRKIGEFVGADRSYVIRFDFQSETISNTHEWCRKGTEPQIDNLQDVPIDVFRWVVDQLIDLQAVHIPKVSEMPAGAAAARREFEAEGIQSMLLVPLVSEGKCIGTVGFEFVNHSKSCSEGEARFLFMSGATLSNILDRKQADDALRTSEKRLQAIFEANPDPVVVYDLEGFPQYLNPAFTEVFGWSLEDVKGQKIPFVPEDQKELTAAMLEKIYRSGKPVSFLSKRLTKQKSLVDVAVSAAIIKGPDGESTGVVVNLTDVSERRKLEARFLQAQKMESVGRLAGGIAHDFNNMLGVILGHTELALQNFDPNLPVHNDLKAIHKAAQRSADLTRQLLAFARRQTAAPTVVDLNDTISGMLKMLRRLIGEDIDLVWIPGANLWPVKIDPAQIDQILANLCVNARDAIAGVGKIVIQTENVALDEEFCAHFEGLVPGQYTKLTVADDGCGMDEQTIDNLFEPFFTTKQIGEGTGLGLSTVYGIVKQNNGFINAVSSPEQGATFTIYLPKTDEKVAPRGVAATESYSRGIETVLVVEDEDSILDLSKEILQRCGYTVLTASTPSQALSIASRYEAPIHLLVTDVVMPEMNGKRLQETISSINPDIKVLFMSGYTTDAIMHRGIIESDIHFLQKPFTVNSLAGKVREALDE